MAPKTPPASGLQPEMIGDVEAGTPPPEAEVDEIGLTPDERAAFDAMREEAPVNTDGDGDGDADPVEPDADPANPDAPPAPVATEEDDDEEPAPAVDPKTGKAPAAPKTVNYSKHQRLLAKAQKEAQDARDIVQREQAERIKLAERLAILNEALQAPPPQQPQQQQEEVRNPFEEQTIDPAEDAIGALSQMQRRQEYALAAQNQVHEAAQSTQATLEDQQLLQDFQRDVNVFSGTEEGRHFMGEEGAYQFIKNSRLIELGISLFDKDPTDPNVTFTQAEINKMVSDFNAEEKWVVNNARAQRKSPAAAIQRLARARGWKPPAAAQAAPAGSAAPAAAAQPRAAAPAARAAPAAPAAAPSAADRLAAESAAAAAGRSLSDGGGAPPALELTPEKLLAMNDEEFGAYVDSLPEHRLAAIMGKQPEGRSA